MGEALLALGGAAARKKDSSLPRRIGSGVNGLVEWNLSSTSCRCCRFGETSHGGRCWPAWSLRCNTASLLAAACSTNLRVRNSLAPRSLRMLLVGARRGTGNICYQ